MRKPLLVKAETALRKHTQNKIWRKTIFNMADGILTPCNVARLWHWFHQVTAPCNVACGSGIMTVNSPSGSKTTLQRETWLWDDMSLNSPNSSTLDCVMWLWNHDSEFTRWQHPAMWHVALGSWHWIRQVAATCNVAGGSGMTCHCIRPNVRHIWNILLVSISATSLHSISHSALDCKILPKSDHPWQKKMTSCRFSRWRISAILDFMGPIMGSIDTIAVNCLFFETRSLAIAERPRVPRVVEYFG